MANKKYKLDGNDYWEASGVYDIGQGDTQRNINDEVATKLATIAEGAEVNQNAFSNVTVGGTTIAADSKTDTLTLTAGSNITLTPNATNDSVTIAANDTTYDNATRSAAGLMSAADKTKLDTLDSADITDNSTVGGSTVEASLTSLKGSLNSIQGQITANIQTTLTANKRYIAGEFFVYNGNLYRVITTINSGAAITIGTNAKATNIGESIPALTEEACFASTNPTQLIASQSYDLTLDYPILSYIGFTLKLYSTPTAQSAHAASIGELRAVTASGHTASFYMDGNLYTLTYAIDYATKKLIVTSFTAPNLYVHRIFATVLT